MKTLSKEVVSDLSCSFELVMLMEILRKNYLQQRTSERDIYAKVSLFWTVEYGELCTC